MRTDATIEKGLQILGAKKKLQDIAFQRPGHPWPYKKRRELLDSYKLGLKKRYREIALELHPDRNGHASAEERGHREDELKATTRAYEFLMNLDVKPPAPAYSPIRIVVVSTGVASSWDQGTTSAATTGTIWPW